MIEWLQQSELQAQNALLESEHSAFNLFEIHCYKNNIQP